MDGYAGKILDIHLTSKNILVKDLEPDFARKYIGGIGFNAGLLYTEMPVGVDPLGPDNILVFGAGALVGTTFPTASRTEVSGKSPLTEQFGTSNSGAFFGARLKGAGFDALIIRGQAPKPVYLLVADGKAEICDASSLWGKDSWETVDSLKARHPGAEVALIGRAGENLVRFASIENGYYDGWGRTGLGAVMGAKRLKAIVVKGANKIPVHDPQGLLEITRKGWKLIQSSPFYLPFTRYGTMNAAIPYGRFNALGTHNFTKETLPNWEHSFGRHIVEAYCKRHIACQSCIIACGHLIEIKEGKYKGLQVKDLEITPVAMFGASVGLDPEAVMQASALCQRHGVDIVSAGGVIAFATELFKRGVLKREDVGYNLDWGDDDAAFRLLGDIVERKGIGNLLAEGTKRAARFFRGAEKYAAQIKGLEIPMIDPRGRWSTWTLGMLTNIRGGDHLRCRNPVENLRFNENKYDYQKERFGFPKEVYAQLDMPGELKEKTIDLESDTVDIAQMSKWAEDLINLYNSLGICIRPPVMQKIGPTILAEAYTALTGVEVTAPELMKAAERTWNLMKLFNLREGEDPAETKFPRRFYEEAIAGKKLEAKKIKAVLRRYYEARGWEPAAGKPGRKILEYLDIDCGQEAQAKTKHEK